MRTTQKEIELSLNQIDSIFQIAKQAYKEYTEPGGVNRYRGLRNFLVFANSTANSIKILESKVSGFDTWYAGVRKGIIESAESRYCSELRTCILKEEHAKSKTFVRFGKQAFADLQRPTGAVSFIINDNHGGDGWKLELPDGSSEMYYINVPGTVGFIHSNKKTLKKYSRLINSSSTRYLSAGYLVTLCDTLMDCRDKFSLTKTAHLRLVR